MPAAKTAGAHNKIIAVAVRILPVILSKATARAFFAQMPFAAPTPAATMRGKENA